MSSVIPIPVTLESTVPQGVAPFTVTSTTLCTNLNAQFLNGNAEAFYRNASNLNAGRAALARLPTSSTANRYLKVGTASTDPAYSPLNGSDITEGTVAPARLGSGTPSTSTFLRGDGQWVAPTGASLTVLEFDLADDASKSGAIYTLTHNLGNKKYIVDYISTLGSAVYYKGVPGVGQSFPDIARIEMFDNTVDVVYDADPDLFDNPPVPGSVIVRLIPYT
jgi:hypothetical protein